MLQLKKEGTMITGSFLGFPLSREILTSFIGSDGHVRTETVVEDLWHFIEVNKMPRTLFGWETAVTQYKELKKIRLPFVPKGVIYRRVPVGQDTEGFARVRELLTPPA